MLVRQFLDSFICWDWSCDFTIRVNIGLCTVNVQSMNWHELFHPQSHMMSHLPAAALISMIFLLSSINPHVLDLKNRSTCTYDTRFEVVNPQPDNQRHRYVQPCNIDSCFAIQHVQTHSVLLDPKSQRIPTV